jgi:hypothetical protein
MLMRIASLTRAMLCALDRPAGVSVPGRPRGVALLIALVTIAILAAAVVQFSYDSRVNLSIASNERDRLKSYFFARSAVNISTLLLTFQFALQNESTETEDDMGKLIGRAMRRSNFQMYQYVDLLLAPFSSGSLDSPIGGLDLAASGMSGVGGFTGEMSVKIVPEDGRLDVNRFAKETISEADLVQLCSMVLDPQYDAIFEEKDEFGDLLDRGAVLQFLVDYIDRNEEAISLRDDCTILGASGDEGRPYDRADNGIRPRNAMLTHVQELHQTHGVTESFMRAFADQMTVYRVGKPNINVAAAPVFYSVLCQHVQLPGNTASDGRKINYCARDPQVAMQVLWLAMALDGVRTFFENPMTVLLAYVGSSNSRLLPSAKKGQPVAFLSVSQLPSYIKDFKADPVLMAEFLGYSSVYQQLVAIDPSMAIDPVAPVLPAWSVDFSRSQLMRAVSTKTPKIYRIFATGIYGTTESTIEAVVDFEKTVRRFPGEKALEEQESDPQLLKEFKQLRKTQMAEAPKGRFLYWRQR